MTTVETGLFRILKLSFVNLKDELSVLCFLFSARGLGQHGALLRASLQFLFLSSPWWQKTLTTTSQALSRYVLHTGLYKYFGLCSNLWTVFLPITDNDVSQCFSIQLCSTAGLQIVVFSTLSSRAATIEYFWNRVFYRFFHWVIG